MDRLNEFIEEWRNGREYVEAHTSGSTGKPKAIRLLKGDMRTSARATCAFFNIGPLSAVGMALSADYIAGKMMAVRALESGARLVAVEPSNDISLNPEDGVIDLFAVVPSQLASFIRHPEYAVLVRNLLVGGAAPADEDLRDLALAGYTVWVSYGMTETCSHVALARGDDRLRIFRAMPGVRFAQADDGRLVIDAPAFSFGRLQTNDMVELIDDSHFRWRGRADGVINSGGIKFVPEELEALYRPFMPCRFYVSHIPDAKWGEAIAVIAECDSRGEVMAALRAGIPDHRQLPKRIFCVDRLPSASNGKIRRLTPAELLPGC